MLATVPFPDLTADGRENFAPCFALAVDFAPDFAAEVFFFGFDTVFLGGASLRAGFAFVVGSAEAPGLEYVPAPRRATTNNTSWAQRKRGVLVIYLLFSPIGEDVCAATGIAADGGRPIRDLYRV